MESSFKRFWKACVSRLGTWVEGYSGVTLTLTGVLGLAAFLYGLHHYRQIRCPQKRHDELRDANQPSSSGTTHAAGPSKPSQSRSGAAAAASAAGPAAATASAVLRLGGAAAVTISAPGVLLEESGAEELEDSATVRPGAAEVLRELLAAGGKSPAVYLLTHVEGDVGEAVVRGALEHAGLVGAAQGQLPPHRLLFCSTPEGKVSIVRQIEPDVHFDAQWETIWELQRFMKRLVHVSGTGGEVPGLASSNVQRAASFAGFFGR